jgi:predicted esterase
VLIVNGSAGADQSEMHPEWLAHITHDFAHRGWIAASIVWPGYGRSTGSFMNEAGDCLRPNASLFLNAHGDERAAALKTLRTRTDVNPSVTLGLGISIGGASMLDLAGRTDRPLTAVINISGGVYHYTTVGLADSNCSHFQDDLVRDFTEFGRDNQTPTLWFYAANDPYFGPDLAQRLLAGYRLGGGAVDYVAVPPF